MREIVICDLRLPQSFCQISDRRSQITKDQSSEAPDISEAMVEKVLADCLPKASSRKWATENDQIIRCSDSENLFNG